MRKLVLTVSALLTVCLLCSTAITSTPIYKVAVKNVIVNLDTGIHFRTVEAMVNPEKCTNVHWYKLSSDAQYKDQAFALLLTAQASGAKVSLSIDGCDGPYPKVNWIYLEN